MVPEPTARRSHFRWSVCALLFFAATINYIDRQVIGILKPTLVQEFGWTDERTCASIVFSFQLAYAIGLLLAGRLMDRVGIRWGFALAITLWSLAAVAHAGADLLPNLKLPALHLDPTTGFTLVSVTGAAAGFALARFALGLGEAGNFPASIKTVAEWFPRRERARTTGIFNAGTNVGAMITPVLVTWLVHFTRQAVGSVVGLGGMAGAVGGMFIALLAGSAYLLALTVIQLLSPRLAPARLA